jgi:exosome complex component RRP43
VTLGVVSSAQGSALAKIGRTAMLAGVKAEICVPERTRPAAGLLNVTVELTPLCSANSRPGRHARQRMRVRMRVRMCVCSTLTHTHMAPSAAQAE